jgi:hypothetical protein
VGVLRVDVLCMVRVEGGLSFGSAFSIAGVLFDIALAWTWVDWLVNSISFRCK